MYGPSRCIDYTPNPLRHVYYVYYAYDVYYIVGVEMEALTGVSVTLLTLYDMCKAVTKDMIIQDVR